MITLIEAKSHLRVDHTDEDADIALKLKFASAIVNDFIGIDADYNADIVDAATFQVLGELYVNREALADPLSPSVKTILERLRAPAFA